MMAFRLGLFVSLLLRYVAEVQASMSTDLSSDTLCKDVGCGHYQRGAPCQCNSRCTHYNDCCPDYTSVCVRPGPRPSPQPASYDCKYPKGPPGGVEQLHLALGSSPSEMTVTFATSRNYSKPPTCSVQGLGEFQGSTRTYTDGGWEGLLHTVRFQGLKPSTTYAYDCGSGPAQFRSAPEVGALPTKFAVVADLGENCNRDGCGNATIARLGAEAKAGSYSLLLHAGDIAYTAGHTCVWDNFFNEMETATSRVPYMVAVGNHEHYYNFSAYRHRFSMPGIGASSQNLWYSFDFGGVHVAAFSTEHDLELQVDWLRADLKQAAANRASVPWIVVMAHKPLYCSTVDYYDCKIGSRKIASFVEAAMQDASVDLFLAGHLHNYERTWPVFNGTVTAKSYTNPGAPVHVVVGMAGDIEGLTYSWMPAPDWRAVNATQLGYATLEFQDPRSMKFEYVLSESGEVADTFTITKQREGIVI